MFGPLLKQYEGIDLHVPPMPGDVQFVYHTYYGFLVFAIQTEHRVSCPPDQALVLLGRFLRFNLTWGMFAYGVIVIPLLAYGNYLSQKRSIKKQLQRQAAAGPQPHSSSRPIDPNHPYAAPQVQLRVTCPACQTTLGVSAAYGDGTRLRCPQCRHEFALRVRL